MSDNGSFFDEITFFWIKKHRFKVLFDFFLLRYLYFDDRSHFIQNGGGRVYNKSFFQIVMPLGFFIGSQKSDIFYV